MYYKSEFLSSHKFEFNKNLYKILLQASNLYLHWYFIEFNLYELKLYVCTLQLQKVHMHFQS